VDAKNNINCEFYVTFPDELSQNF